MNAQHTRGPWRVDRLDHNGQSVVMNDNIEIATCWHHCVGSIEQEMHANARLIAAAPDMLAALRQVVDETAGGMVPPSTDAIDAARVAIAKAEGR